MDICNNLSHKFSNVIYKEFINELKLHLNYISNAEKIINIESRKLKKIKLCINLYSYINDNIEYVVRASNIFINEYCDINIKSIEKNMALLYTIYNNIFKFKNNLNEIIKENKKMYNKNKSVFAKLFEILEKSKEIFENLHLQIPYRIIANANVYELQHISSVDRTYEYKITSDINELNDCNIKSYVYKYNNNTNNNLETQKSQTINNSSEKRVSKTKSREYRESRPKRNVPIVNYAGMQ
jgi:hypothetical protein